MPHYENVPFDIPESWEWATIEDVTVNRDSERIPLSLAERKKQQNKVYNYYGAAGVIDKVENYLFDERLLLVGEDGANLLSRSKDNAFFAEGKYWVNNHAHVLDCPNKSVLDYVAFVINSMSLENYITGSAQPKLTQDNLNKILIPLPPEKEQYRIIESVNDYFPNISLLEGEIVEMDSFIQKAKSKILDLAIHGKLVPQDPNDEPTVELLKRINPKFEPCDNAHYENIPAGWASIPLEGLCYTINGLWKGKKPPFVNVGVIRNANFTKDFKLDFSNIAYLDVEEKQYEKRKLQCGDIIVEKSGGSDNQPVGRTILFDKTDEDYSFSNFTAVLRINDGYPVLPEYLNLFLHLVYQKGITKRMQTQTTGIHNLIFDQFLAIPIMLPPLSEQKRLVDKVEYLSQILDRITAEL